MDHDEHLRKIDENLRKIEEHRRKAHMCFLIAAFVFIGGMASVAVMAILGI